MSNSRVAIMMGSPRDWGTMKGAAAMLDKIGVPHEVFVTSAHKTPSRTHAYVEGLERRGVQVAICGAGAAAHLAGVVAATFSGPVIAVPVASTDLNGFDALLASVQMPSGVPVATVAVGSMGAKNAGILAAQILALGDEALAERLAEFREDVALNLAAEGDALLSELPEDRRGHL